MTPKVYEMKNNFGMEIMVINNILKKEVKEKTKCKLNCFYD